MKFSNWFRDHLRASADGFVWGTEQVPEARRYVQPPAGLGEWSVARHVFHMLCYEQTIALPSMRQWLGDPIPSTEGLDEDVDWRNTGESVESLLDGFRKVRQEQIALLPNFSETAWTTTCEAVWGPVTLLWVVSKTYQHTAEHTNDVMRIGLFWDAYLGR